jgi:glycine hydroxymethyltransferase
MDVMSSFGLTGRQAESLLRQAHLTVNRNSIPLDANGPWYTSGVRVGTPATTTLGMKPTQMKEIANILVSVLKKAKPDPTSKAKATLDPFLMEEARTNVKQLLKKFPLYPELLIDNPSIEEISHARN